ncbi:MAG: hypothetical protein MK138_09405, partial [Planctomycetes bacterium]|nr:hypothetical protein [Planctomycetota bacterium]
RVAISLISEYSEIKEIATLYSIFPGVGRTPPVPRELGRAPGSRRAARSAGNEPLPLTSS